MRERHQCYMWVSGAINIKDYTETVTLHRLSVVRIMMSDTYEKCRKTVAFILHYTTILKTA